MCWKSRVPIRDRPIWIFWGRYRYIGQYQYFQNFWVFLVFLYQGDSSKSIHDIIGHPGIRRLNHLSNKAKKFTFHFRLEEVRRTCRECKICAELKPWFYRPQEGTLIKATHPWERIAVDFKGPVKGKRPYLLVVIDEFSRFPFAFPCRDVSARTVIECLTQFCLFGMPGYVHSNRGSAFMSAELQKFLVSRNVATSRFINEVLKVNTMSLLNMMHHY